MNFNFVNYLYLFKLLLLIQNNPTAVWLILLGMRNKKKNVISEKKYINAVIGFYKWTSYIASKQNLIYCVSQYQYQVSNSLSDLLLKYIFHTLNHTLLLKTIPKREKY